MASSSGPTDNTSASSPVTVPPSPPIDEETDETVILRESSLLGGFLLSGMSDETGSFFENMLLEPDPSWVQNM